MLLVTVSVAVIVWLPAVLSVALKVPTPLASGELAGRTAWPSVLVKWTVPMYPVAVLLFWSWAVTVKLNDTPAVAVAGALMLKCTARTLTVRVTVLLRLLTGPASIAWKVMVRGAVL